jgi:uncharacterized protein with HEPN domain
MSEPEFRLVDYLEHMLEAVDRILAYTKDKTEDEFQDNRLLQDAVLRNIAVLGEAARNFLDEAPEKVIRTSEIPFAKIYGMRNQIEHGYSTVDFGIVWNVITGYVPDLRPKLEALLKQLADQQGAF